MLEHLRAAGIEEIFQTVICSAEVPHGKPAPDVFEEACRQIGADPKKCRACECIGAIHSNRNRSSNLPLRLLTISARAVRTACHPPAVLTN